MLGFGRDLARAVGVERLARLTRIEGGLALQAPGIALMLLDDRLLLAHWARSRGELRTVQNHVTRILGGTYPIEDMRAVAAQGAAGRAVKPQERDADRIIPDPVEPEHQHELEHEATTPAPTVEDDLGPGF